MAEMLIVPGRVTSGGMVAWLLTPGSVPVSEIRVAGPNSVPANLREFRLPSPPGYVIRLIAVLGLVEDTIYDLSARLEDGTSHNIAIRTLPSQLADSTDTTIAFGSCYCFGRDKTGESGPPLSPIYPPDPHRLGDESIRLRFLCGDQVYLDLTPETGNPLIVQRPKTWSYYLEQWLHPNYRRFIAATPNLMLADDHEFWNDYPHDNVWQLWNEGTGGPMEHEMTTAFSSFQSCLNLDPIALFASTPASLPLLLQHQARTFSFRLAPLEFFVLDTRCRRNRFDASQPHFSPPGELAQALIWLRNLSCPGVLVLGQPLVETPASWFQRMTHTMGDVNLPDFDDDFASLWEAIFAAPHDVLILSGDIHYSRVRVVTKATSGSRRAIEIISSPFQRIPGPASDMDNGVMDGKVEWKRNRGVANWTAMDVEPSNKSPVYATVSFRPMAGGSVRARVTWWTAKDGDCSRADRINNKTFEINLQ